MVAYAAAQGVELRIDSTETQVRRPRANRCGRRAFVSGKKKQNTIKTTTVSDSDGRTPWAGAMRPGPHARPDRGQDRGHRGPAAPASHRHRHGDSGYQGLAKALPDQVHAPPSKPGKDAPAEQFAVYEAARKQQASRRICVEHAIAEPKQWRSLQRWIERRQYYAETHVAVAGLVSDRAARR